MLDQASQGLSYGPYLPDLPDSIMSGAGMCMLITARAVSTSTSACTMVPVPAGRLFPVVGMPFVMTTVVMRFTRLILIIIGTMMVMVMVMIMVRSLPRG